MVSGNLSRTVNPTQYRDPSHYEAFIASTTMPVDGTNVYGFDMVLSKSVETYIKVDFFFYVLKLMPFRLMQD